MNDIQEKHERAVGLQFIRWYNDNNHTRYEYIGRPGLAPDLTFSNGEQLHLEITDAYYDSYDAEIKWKHARNIPNAPRHWRGVNFEASLARDIERRIENKAHKRYGGKCYLLIYINPPLTTASEMQALLPTINISMDHAFDAIYLAGNFPSSVEEIGGFHAWKLE